MATRQQPSSQSTGNVTSVPEKPTYSDSSGAIFSMYINKAQKFDKENADNWDGQANGILLFSGIFSATVATFIGISYPNLQQDPLAIQSILVQISQQLANATTNGGSTNTLSPSTQLSFVPPSSVVFINLVWFLSLALTLTCALIATLMQQWARRYLQMVQRTHAPHVSAHIREYFVQGANKFGIHALVEVLPTLLLSSVMLFFAGLVVFAFRANHVVAYFTLAIVAICSLSYIALTLLPLFFPDCPYHTPLTTLTWYGVQITLLLFSYAAHRCANILHTAAKLQGTVNEKTVKSLMHWHETKASSISKGIFSKFENSAKPTSMEIYQAALCWTLSLLDEDSELEEFVSGIPGLRESEALASYNNGSDPRRTVRAVLAVLPGPTSFHAPFPWSIIRLAQRATTSNLSEPIRRQRFKACLKSLYYIPGAIRDLLAPYAAGKYFCLEILPLLNSVESLEIIEELWDTPRDDVAVSVRCAAAVVYSFMITPPRRTLEKFLPPNVPFIGDVRASQRFLSKRLSSGRTGANVGVAAGSDLHGDNARLQNIVRFLEDIKTMLGYIDMPWWATDSAQSVHQERRFLFDSRNTAEYRAGKGIFEQHGHRTSPAFVPAVQQDLVTLTLGIITRDPVGSATLSPRKAFQGACTGLLQVASAQTLPQTPDQSLVQFLARSLELSLPPFLGTSPLRPLTQVRGLSLPQSPAQPLILAQEPAPPAPLSPHVDGVEMVTRESQRVVEDVGVRPQIEDRTTVHDGPSPSTTTMPQTASGGPSRSSSSVASPLLPLLPAVNPGDRSLPDSAGALV